MRIVGYIEHPIYKITIMHMNHRFALKIENDGIEQTYKLRSSDTIQNAEDIKKRVNPEFLKEIDTHFQALEKTRLGLLSISQDDKDGEEFEEII